MKTEINFLFNLYQGSLDMFLSTKDFIGGVDSLISHVTFEDSRNVYFQEGLKKYLGNTEFEVHFRNFVSDIVKPSILNSKRFIYNSAIVSLYGYFENFLENIIREFIRNINDSIKSYAMLPDQIQKFHLESSIELIKKIQRDRNINDDDKKTFIKKVVKNMNSCVQEVNDFTLNEHAFSIHTSNFRYDTIHELFKKVGVIGISRKALDKPILASELRIKRSIDTVVDKKILIYWLMHELNDLAQRRNEIAHGNISDNLESIELFKIRANLIRCFGVAIDSVLKDHFYEFVYGSIEKLTLGIPIKVFPQIRVFGFNNNSIGQEDTFKIIEIGDEVFAINADSPTKFVYGKILSIRKAGNEVDKIELPTTDEFAIGVDFNVSSNMKKREIHISKKA